MLLTKRAYLLVIEQFAVSLGFICHPFDWSHACFIPRKVHFKVYHHNDIDNQDIYKETRRLTILL